jgi:hypothetical protein
MKHFLKLRSDLDVTPLAHELADNPGLWDAYKERTADESSPHFGVPDIWVRFRDREELASPHAFAEPHFATFYPAWDVLPSLHGIVHDLMHQVRAVYLGGILITKIPAGGVVKPHDDRGGWHAEFHDTKVYVPIQSNFACINFCEDEHVNMLAGQAWTFNNLETHSVENRGQTDRITAIICFRTK